MVNVLLISFDTLRSDVAYSGRFPTINRILARGASFTTAVASAPLTPLSHASVFSGMHPPNHGLRHLFREKVSDEVPLLAESMLDAGYRTGAITSCPGLNSWYGFDRGFESFDDEIPLLADGSNPLETVDVKLRGTALKRANVVTDRAIDWLKQAPDEEFFLFVHFFDSHWPYEPPEDYGVPVDNPYEGEIAYMDHHLGRLLDWIESEGLDEDLAIVFFSDHGEDLEGWYPNDKAGDRGHPEESGHGALLFDQTQLVALSVSWPDHLPAGEWLSNQVRLLDIAPTILELSGVEMPKPLDGISLLPIINGKEQGHRPAYFESFYREEISSTRLGAAEFKPLAGVRLDDKWKVVWEPSSTSSGVSVFDLHSDPGEWRPNLSLLTELAPIPTFAAEPFDRATFVKVMGQAEGKVPGAVLLMAVIEAVARREEIGLSLRGDLFIRDRVKPETRILVELTFPNAHPTSSDIDWLSKAISGVTNILAAVPSLNEGRADGLIVLCEVPDSNILQIDFEFIGPGDPVKAGANAVLLRAPSGRMPTVRRQLPSTFNVTLGWNRLWGWSLDAAVKIRREDCILASDTIAKIRNEILVPVLIELAGTSMMKSGTYDPRFEKCMPAKFENGAYVEALVASIELATESLSQLAKSRDISLPIDNGEKVFEHIKKILAAPLGSSQFDK